MVGISAFTFISRFNNSVLRRSKSFNTPDTRFSREFLALLYKEGYIFSYSYAAASRSFLVYPNHRSINFKFSAYSKISRRINFSFFRLKTLSNSGYFCVVRTCFGLQFSDTSRFNKVGGEPIFIIKYF